MICPGCFSDIPFADLPTRRVYQYGAWWHRRCWHKFRIKSTWRVLRFCIKVLMFRIKGAWQRMIFRGGPWKA